MTRLRWAFCCAAFVLTAGYAEGQAKTIRFAGGPKEGMHGILTEKACEALHKQGIEIEVVGTSDSAQNLDLLREGEVDFGLVPQDLLSEDFQLHPDKGLAVVDRVFFDDLHILVRQPLHIAAVTDLQRVRIWAGEAGSATRMTAGLLFDSFGTPLEDLDKDHLCSFNELEKRRGESADLWEMERALDRLPDWFAGRRLDAAVLVATPGTSALCRLVGSGQVSLLSLDRGTLRRLIAENKEATPGNRLLRQMTIHHLDRGTYPGQQETLTTIAIPVLLVSKVDVDVGLAAALQGALLKEWSQMSQELDRSCRLPRGAPAAKPLAHAGLPLLKGISRNEPRRFPLPLILWTVGAFVVIVVFIWYLAVKWDRKLVTSRGLRFLHDAWTHYRWITVSFISLLGLVVGSTALTFYAEQETNDNFATPLESFWSITVCLFSGLEDRVPYTQPGRFGVVIALFAGGAFAVLTSALVTKEVLMTKKKVPTSLKDHFLILNWNDRVSELIRELHHPLLTEYKKTPIVVLSDKKGLTLGDVVNLGNGQQGEVVDVYLKTGDPAHEQSLRQANAHKARCVLILASDETSDDRTIRSVLMLRKIARAEDRQNLHVIAELTKPANASTLDELASDFPGLLENVAGLRVRTCLLAQTALNAGISGFYMDLLSVSDDSNEVYTQKVPSRVVKDGMHFRDYAALVLKDATEPMVPVGIQRTTDGKAKVLINPQRGNDEGHFREGDSLVLIGLKPPPPSALPDFAEEPLCFGSSRPDVWGVGSG